MRLIFLITLLLFTWQGQSQPNSTSIFSHNDYSQPIPFHLAYHHQVGYMEADIFLKGNRLLVAHTEAELVTENTLERMYLSPLREVIERNAGYVYPDSNHTLVLMIDIKSEAQPTLAALVHLLNDFPELTHAKNFSITISGNRPGAQLWTSYPDYISFDGRPDEVYTADQLKRVKLISASFQSYSRWNGKGVLPEAERSKIISVVEKAHSLKKKMRFWAIPDFENSWLYLSELGMDIINTDRVEDVARLVSNWRNCHYCGEADYPVHKALAHTDFAAAPRNVILMIGDGMGLTSLYAAFTANRGKLNIFNMTTSGFSVTNAVDSYITDSAAGATAMATGNKTNNRFIGLSSQKERLANLPEQLQQHGVHSAIITSGDVTDATPGAFYAHQPERSMSNEIARDFLSSAVDIMIGGGGKWFNDRPDGHALPSLLSEKGYTMYSRLDVAAINQDKFIVLDNAAELRIEQGRKDFLQQAFTKTVSILSGNRAPFFIMLEGAQIDAGGHNNDLPYVITELLDFDQVVGAAMKYVDANRETLLIVTADHETGGLSLLAGDLRKGCVHGQFSTNDHTSVMVPVFAYGPGASAFNGVYPNTAIHDKILELIRARIKR